MNVSEQITWKAYTISIGIMRQFPTADDGHLAFFSTTTALALLTSPIKTEREAGKAMVRARRVDGVSHAKPSAVE